MGTPTNEHELRVAHLQTLASLGGFTTDITLGLDVVPDVCRIDVVRRRLFVGDAKQTESPGNVDTRRRLVRYIAAARPLVARCSAFTICIGHGRVAHADA